MLDRRQFLRGAALTAAPLLLPPLRASAAARAPLALVTADTESHVAVVSPASGRVVRRIGTVERPRSIRATRDGRAIVLTHAEAGAVTLLEGGGSAGAAGIRARRVLRGFGAPRYTVISRSERLAYVSDSGHGELAVVDLATRAVIRRVPVGPAARHLTLDPAGRVLWVALGSSATELATIDLRDPRRPRPGDRIRVPFPAHDVGFSPSGRRVWLTAGSASRIAILDTGGRVQRMLGADAGPQHLAFGAGVAYVTSGDAGSVAIHALSDGRLLHRTRVAIGSYNIKRAGGRVVTPSLATGGLTLLDVHGAVKARIHVAAAAHDACVI